MDRTIFCQIHCIARNHFMPKCYHLRPNIISMQIQNVHQNYTNMNNYLKIKNVQLWLYNYCELTYHAMIDDDTKMMMMVMMMIVFTLTGCLLCYPWSSYLTSQQQQLSLLPMMEMMMMVKTCSD